MLLYTKQIIVLIQNTTIHIVCQTYITKIMSVISIFATLGASALSATLGLGGGYVLLCVISTILEIVLVVSITFLLSKNDLNNGIIA